MDLELNKGYQWLSCLKITRNSKISPQYPHSCHVCYLWIRHKAAAHWLNNFLLDSVYFSRILTPQLVFSMAEHLHSLCLSKLYMTSMLFLWRGSSPVKYKEHKEHRTFEVEFSPQPPFSAQELNISWIPPSHRQHLNAGWVSQRETNEWLFSDWKHSFLQTAEMLPRLREASPKNENVHGKSSLQLLSFSDPLSIIFMNISTNCFSVTSLPWLNLTSAASFAQVLSILVL